MSASKHLVTAALPYANGPLHIGHIAGVYLPADIYTRFLRLKNEDVAFICGSDEHGAAITLRAKKDGVSPQDIVDKYHGINKKAFSDFKVNFDIYHRTSAPEHHVTAQDFFLKLLENGSFEVKTSEQYYDEEAQQFLADRYISGDCPKCGKGGAYGDQCESCGSALSPDDLINPISTLTGKSPVKRETSHWYLPMNKHEDWLRTWIEEGKLDGVQLHDPKKWRNQVIGQCKSWIDGGLHSRAMTRDLDWGVRVPVEGAEDKVLYVWLDAPIGYITATKEWAKANNKDWKSYWQSKESEITHFIAKDNIVFHSIIFPILLKEHGGYNLPVNVPSNEFLNLEGKKISTSRNWAVWLHEYIEDYPERIDDLRYVLCSIAPESKDSEFTWKDFQARINGELVAIYGNFVNRAMVLCHKYYDGKVPANSPQLEEADDALTAALEMPRLIEKSIRAHKYREALQHAMQVARIGNKFLADTEPWKLWKTEPEKVQPIIYTSLQICKLLSQVFQTFLPESSAKMAAMLNVDLTWEETFTPLEEGKQLNKATLLFRPFEDEDVAKQVEKLKASMESNATTPAFKENVDFDQFSSMDLRVGTILTAEKVKKSNKLLQFTVDMGSEKRTILSGIAKHYSAEECVGQQVMVMANLAPRKIMGTESQGMILLAENTDGSLAFMSPDKKRESGSIIA